MPVTTTYQVKCDVCWGVMGGEYETREDAEQARKELGWEDDDSRTACPAHNTRDRATQRLLKMDEEARERIREDIRIRYDDDGNPLD